MRDVKKIERKLCLTNSAAAKIFSIANKKSKDKNKILAAKQMLVYYLGDILVILRKDSYTPDDKHIIGVYTFEEFKKNGRYIRQLKPSSRGKYVTDESDFVDTDKSFADVFPNLEQGKLYYVDDEAYYIQEK